MALINGFKSPDGLRILELDRDTGETVHQTIFSELNYGNGAYTILQYLEGNDLLFNSFMGPIRVIYPQE